MPLLLPLLLSLLAVLIGGLYLLGVFRRRRPGEPPLDRGPIPWLGHAFEFRRHPVKFLERMKRKHGEVFTVQVAGMYITFLLDSLSFGAFIKESPEKLNLSKFSVKVAKWIFGIEALGDENQSREVHKHLRGAGLEALTHNMMSNWQNVILQNIRSSSGKKTWTEDDLCLFSYKMIFQTGYLSLFGNVAQKSQGSLEKAKQRDLAESEALFTEFQKFNQIFPKLILGLMNPRINKEAKRLKEFFWDTLSIQKTKTRENMSRWVLDIQQHNQEMGMKESMINRHMLILLFASQANTGLAAFWLLFFLMKHPEAMDAVKEEVNNVLKESGQEVVHDGPLINVTYDMLMKTPVLDSALEETLRLIVVLFLFRSVLQEMTLKTADGCEYNIRKGDSMAAFPYLAIHTNPEIHPDPQSFKYDRFLNPDGSKKTNFFKSGKKVKYFSMPWGAGVSKCPGRFFAVNELKQFLFLMLSYFDLELMNPKEETPDADAKRLGFGVIHPTREVQFRYRLKV
ncbi:5-beta-cholestane-3-alpha,7-alpha-diol 12-alpha-hydroxylase-like [Notolabrus celidotus]|uniref:5-beta-cholestane-3-alpha,7-alpha-diol 12-alpha-hydroxylase-like n=1 Tax=Notolabrus celidotus TaxID=1203425 RepID=UPI00149038E2|nr:5-beta-cholestane-3-alpha,7-alpha-diol 12-alpha-hydroxylase-like [Notolabrus celidotus]